MSNTTTSANMGMPVPVVGVDPGPDYATDVNTCLNTIDSHDHTSGNGVPITPSGMNINSDLSFGGNDATNLRSTRFTAQGSPLTGSSPDLGCVYVSGVDLYFNDVNGNQVRITASGSVSGSAGTITGLPSGTASAAFTAGTGTFTFQQASSTGANIDAATYVLRYPGSYPSPSGNYIALQAPAALATGFSLTLPATLPGTTGFWMTGTTAGVMSWTGVDNLTLQYASNVVSIKNLGVGTAQIAAQAVTSAKIANLGVGTAQLADAACTTIKIADANVTTAKLADTSVTSAKNGLNYLVTNSVSGSGTTPTSAGTFVKVQSVRPLLIGTSSGSINLTAATDFVRIRFSTPQDLLTLGTYGATGSRNYNFDAYSETGMIFNLSAGSYTVEVIGSSGATWTNLVFIIYEL